jgi:hypothetical protein
MFRCTLQSPSSGWIREEKLTRLHLAVRVTTRYGAQVLSNGRQQTLSVIAPIYKKGDKNWLIIIKEYLLHARVYPTFFPYSYLLLRSSLCIINQYMYNLRVSIYFYSSFFHLKHRASVKRFVSLQFLNLRHSVRHLGRVIRPSQGSYLRLNIE